MHRQLKLAGFKNVRFFPRAFHTVGMSPEGRHELFLEAFSFRRNYWAQVVDNDPSDDGAKRQLARIDDDLAELELDFEDEAFFTSSSRSASSASAEQGFRIPEESVGR